MISKVGLSICSDAAYLYFYKQQANEFAAQSLRDIRISWRKRKEL